MRAGVNASADRVSTAGSEWIGPTALKRTTRRRLPRVIWEQWSPQCSGSVHSGRRSSLIASAGFDVVLVLVVVLVLRYVALPSVFDDENDDEDDCLQAARLHPLNRKSMLLAVVGAVEVFAALEQLVPPVAGGLLNALAQGGLFGLAHWPEAAAYG